MLLQIHDLWITTRWGAFYVYILLSERHVPVTCQVCAIFRTCGFPKEEPFTSPGLTDVIPQKTNPNPLHSKKKSSSRSMISDFVEKDIKAGIWFCNFNSLTFILLCPLK